MTLRATGAATALPLPACSASTATAICGSSAGAKAMNSAWSRSLTGVFSSVRATLSSCESEATWAVPVFAAMRYGAFWPILSAVPPCWWAVSIIA